MGFFNILSITKHEKLKGDPLGKIFFEKDPLVSPGTVCYAEKQKNFFWISSVGEMVQFDTIISDRTFEELFH